MLRLATSFCAALMMIGAHVSAWAAKVGPEFRVNSTIADHQYKPAVAQLTNGFVIVWISTNQDAAGTLGIYGQRYAANGAKVGVEFRVNTTTAGSQSNPAVAGLTGGGFVVVWQSDGQDGSSHGIYGQRYRPNGAKIGPEFPVNTTTPGSQSNPAIAALGNGGFVVTWNSSAGDIHARRYNPVGTPLSGEIPVNVTTADNQVESAVAALTSGGFVVVWQSYQQDGSEGGIYGRRFSAAGAAMGGEFRVNRITANHQRQPAVAGLTNGGFVVVWTSLTLDVTSDNIRARRYSATGVAEGNEFGVNVYKTSYQLVPSVAGLTDGGFLVTWASYTSSLSPTEYGYGVLARRYSAAGAAMGGEFSANTHKFDDQGYRGQTGSPAVAPLPDGKYVITWPSYNQDQTNTDGVYAQRFN